MARSRDDDPFYFEGFDNPTTTPVPDVVFDRFLPILGEAEIKALLYIIRRTLGFKKNHDPISFNQFLRGITTRDGRVLDQGCGVRNRTTLSMALKSLEQRGIVVSTKGVDDRGENATTVYSLRFKGDVENSTEGVVRFAYHRSTDPAPPVVRPAYLQQTDQQETVEQQTDHSSTEMDAEALHKIDLRSMSKKQVRVQSIVDNPAAQSADGQGHVAPPPSTGTGGPRRRGRAPAPNATGTMPAEVIDTIIGEVTLELHDELDNLADNVRWARRLWAFSGLPVNDFVQYVLYPARSRTKQQGTIRKPAAEGGGLKNKMPYFFAVVEDLAGLRAGAPS
jgi:hypothetical protein